MSSKVDYSEQWKRETCTSNESKTDAFGEIKFMGSNEIVAKYIRVHFKTEMNTILKLLYENWGLRKPRLIISVTGGAKITLKPRLRETFSKGLVKVATTTNALITSGGSYSGCMKLVGEAFRENSLSIDLNHKINLLGIASWGSVCNNYKLINASFI